MLLTVYRIWPFGNFGSLMNKSWRLLSLKFHVVEMQQSSSKTRLFPSKITPPKNRHLSPTSPRFLSHLETVFESKWVRIFLRPQINHVFRAFFRVKVPKNRPTQKKVRHIYAFSRVWGQFWTLKLPSRLSKRSYLYELQILIAETFLLSNCRINRLQVFCNNRRNWKLRFWTARWRHIRNLRQHWQNY